MQSPRFSWRSSGFFSKKSFPGVGGSIGLTRLFYVLEEKQLFSFDYQSLLDFAVIPVSESEFDEAFNVAKRLRDKNYSATVILIDKKLGDKMGYASKLAKKGIVIGEEEIGATSLNAKNFTTGEIEELNIEVVSNPEDFWAD